MNLQVTHNGRSGTKSRGGKPGTVSRRNRKTWATPANAERPHMTWRPGRVGKERNNFYSGRMPLDDGAKAKRSRDGKQETGARK